MTPGIFIRLLAYLYDSCHIDKTNFILLLLKEVCSARLRESDIYPFSSKTPAPQYQPIDRKKRKEKIVEKYTRDRAA